LEIPQRRTLVARGVALSGRWSASLLLAGCSCATLAFLLGTLVGVNRAFAEKPRSTCFHDRVCESGRNYHAETLSELVSSPKEPASKLFYSFTVIASICLIISRYPWELRNVYTGKSFLCSVPALRTLVPPIGMLTVAQIPVVPRSERNSLAIKVMCNVHTFGAVAFVGGYLIMEAYTLVLLRRHLGRLEKHLRWIVVAGGATCMLMFVVAGTLYTQADSLGICCNDDFWGTAKAYREFYGIDGSSPEERSQIDLAKQIYGESVLWNTANETTLTLKKMEFWSETLSGVFIIASHALIWWFCEERQLIVDALIPS